MERNCYGVSAGEMGGTEAKLEKSPLYGCRRICPAQQNALTNVAFVLVTLARQYRAIEDRVPNLEFVNMMVLTREWKDGISVLFLLIKIEIGI